MFVLAQGREYKMRFGDGDEFQPARELSEAIYRLRQGGFSEDFIDMFIELNS
jgi:hypothetical protein